MCCVKCVFVFRCEDPVSRPGISKGISEGIIEEEEEEEEDGESNHKRKKDDDLEVKAVDSGPNNLIIIEIKRLKDKKQKGKGFGMTKSKPCFYPY